MSRDLWMNQRGVTYPAAISQQQRGVAVMAVVIAQLNKEQRFLERDVVDAERREPVTDDANDAGNR